MYRSLFVRFPSAILPAMAVGLCWVIAGAGHAQGGDSRPIEFSEPRGADASATNDQRVGAERRRLTDLEDRLSKTFNFFESGDSFGGASAPQPVPQRRAPVATKQRPRSAGFFGEEGDWVFSDPLQKFKVLLEEDEESKEVDGGFGGENDGPGPVDLLESLKTDDWLVKGTLGENFWEMQVPGSGGGDAPLAVAISKSDGHNQFSAPTSAEDLRPRLEGVFGMTPHRPGSSSGLEHAREAFADGAAYELGQLSRPADQMRREQYRALLGLSTEAVKDPLAAPGYDPSPGGFNPSNPFRSNPFARDSIQVASPSGLSSVDSMYPQAPSMPVAPAVPGFSEPAGLDPVFEGSTHTRPGVLADPFYRMPQRGY